MPGQGRQGRSDAFQRKARREGYRARSTYKLKDIQKRSKIFKNGDKVLDLGAAPGGWSQVISKLKKNNAKCYAFDLLPMENVKGIDFKNLDLFSEEFEEIIENLATKVDLILSDMSVNLSGIKLIDDESNKELNFFCLDLSKKILSNKGALIIKTFTNENLKSLKLEFENAFERVFVEKPKASKTSSAEVYLLGLVPK